ncbi:sialate O-acetylesterase [Pleionea sediminis]|uniref:sialate O-acetylesterase n=1 Tax=Pleionea sediminis TaxID=2569479 RepID=UPI001186E045|nr:sialate O-acetylesterase [Pleionea sediminis]
MKENETDPFGFLNVVLKFITLIIFLSIFSNVNSKELALFSKNQRLSSLSETMLSDKLDWSKDTAFTNSSNVQKPVKVYILFGQSNMVGFGAIEPLGTPGTLVTEVKLNGKFPYLLDSNEQWITRNDVWYKGVISAKQDSWLTVGAGANRGHIGPELGFGHIVGNYHDAPVLIIKSSIGNRSIAWDILPPGSSRYVVNGYTYAGYGDRDDRWSDSDPYTPINWYAGKQYDEFVAEAKNVLDNFNSYFPQWADRGFQISGYGWFQGHKDTLNGVYAERYEFNMVNLIKAIRSDFNTPLAPFVIATIGFNGYEMTGNTAVVANAQRVISGDTGNYPEFDGNVITVDTRGFWRSAADSPSRDGSHYRKNAETFMLVGEAMGKGMLTLHRGNISTRQNSMTTSQQSPSINEFDIANYSSTTGLDKWWYDTRVSGRPKGQTFTSSNQRTQLNAISFQVGNLETTKAEPIKTYLLRIGLVNGDEFSEVHRETFTQKFTWSSGGFMSWNLKEPFHLEPNTHYGIDIGMLSSSSHWKTGIPYLQRTADEYFGGSRYMSGTEGRGRGNHNMNHMSGDMVFHMDISRIKPAPGTIAISKEPPPIDDLDIANYGTPVGLDKWWYDTRISGRPKGQTFTTSNKSTYLNSVSYQVGNLESTKAEPEKTYVIRVGKISGDQFIEFHRETFIQQSFWNPGEYMTWTFRKPPLLKPNTQYAIDIGMKASTTHWKTGIPYLQISADEYAGGARYMSGTSGRGIGDRSIQTMSGDRIFHIDMSAVENTIKN